MVGTDVHARDEMASGGAHVAGEPSEHDERAPVRQSPGEVQFALCFRGNSGGDQALLRVHGAGGIRSLAGAWSPARCAIAGEVRQWATCGDRELIVWPETTAMQQQIDSQQDQRDAATQVPADIWSCMRHVEALDSRSAFRIVMQAANGDDPAARWNDWEAGWSAAVQAGEIPNNNHVEVDHASTITAIGPHSVASVPPGVPQLG